MKSLAICSLPAFAGRGKMQSGSFHFSFPPAREAGQSPKGSKAGKKILPREAIINNT
jgi:hypothetical protein